MKKTLYVKEESVNAYKILKVINSVSYRIGTRLTKREVQELCNKPTWKVVIT